MLGAHSKLYKAKVEQGLILSKVYCVRLFPELHKSSDGTSDWTSPADDDSISFLLQLYQFMKSFAFLTDEEKKKLKEDIKKCTASDVNLKIKSKIEEKLKIELSISNVTSESIFERYSSAKEQTMDALATTTKNKNTTYDIAEATIEYMFGLVFQVAQLIKNTAEFNITMIKQSSQSGTPDISMLVDGECYSVSDFKASNVSIESADSKGKVGFKYEVYNYKRII